MFDEKEYEYVVTAAGRVNIIGEHVDYCGGKVFPAALSLRNAVYVRRNGTDRINISFTDIPDRVSLSVDDLEAGRSLKYGNYQAGSALMWKNAGHKLVGCDMVQDCTVPFGSGLSSSAAIEVSTIAALAVIAGEKFDPVEVALLAQKAEREFAGVNCGIMDQYASACGKKDCAILLDCKTLEREYVPLELGEYTLVIADCKKPHSLVESKYNERRAQTEEALSLLAPVTGASCLAEIVPAQLEAHKGLLSEVVYRRAKHVAEECERVHLAADAMKRGDIIGLGKLLSASHASLRDLYEVTGKELDALASAAQAHPACLGSRMTGAGFGGCTVSIVRADAAEDFRRTVGEAYERATGYRAQFYDASVADGITVAKIGKE